MPTVFCCFTDGHIPVTAALILALPLLYILLQWAALRRMERGWQVAALAKRLRYTTSMI